MAETNPWWRLDLLDTYIITSIIITNRGDCCAERINGAQIHVGNSLQDNGASNPQWVFHSTGVTGCRWEQKFNSSFSFWLCLFTAIVSLWISGNDSRLSKEGVAYWIFQLWPQTLGLQYDHGTWALCHMVVQDIKSFSLLNVSISYWLCTWLREFISFEWHVLVTAPEGTACQKVSLIHPDTNRRKTVRHWASLTLFFALS